MSEQKFTISKAEDAGDSIRCEYNDGKGNVTIHFFANPHYSIEHVDDQYILDRFPNAKGVRQKKFIREEYGRQIGAFIE